tara:strand:- start:564 stop:1208 length:645 start_codon:yes stop_codon:yes gene_type:complete
MGLNLSIGTDTDYINIIKYNARTGQVLVPQEDGPDAPISNWVAAIDLENIQELWLCFSDAGPKSAPLFVNGERTPRPDPIGDRNWSDGFEVLTYTANELNNDQIGFRRWRGNANAHKEAIINAYQSFERDKNSNPGAVPVFECHPRSQSTKHGGIWIPDLTLVKWANRETLDGMNNEGTISNWKSSFLRDTNGQVQQVIEDSDATFGNGNRYPL